MEYRQGSRRGRRGGPRRPFPLWIALAGGATGVAALTTAFRGAPNWSVAFGDALLVEAGLCFTLAWFAYLKRDGIRIAPRKRGAAAPESWKDRVPGLGKDPAPPMPMPGPEGPQGEDYERLAAAEEALRRKILGDTGDAPDKYRRASPGGAATASFIAAGGALLVLALLFEYAIPALQR